MRKQMDGLAGLIQLEMPNELQSRSLFVFVNKWRDKLKNLYWENNGFVVWYKRLEKQRFAWPKKNHVPSLSIQELNLLLDGYDVFGFKPHQKMSLNSMI
jgi:transposase